ncbi:MAG: outer membrane beta-barrel protein [Bacteroidota bacterium]
MKRFTITLLALLVVTGICAQKMELKGLGSFQSTWLFNKGISDRGDEQDYAPGWGWSYGLGYAFYITDKIGLEINGLQTVHTGYYSGTLDSSKTYNSYSSLSLIDIPVLFKLRSETGAFLEAGPMYSLVTKAKFVYDGACQYPSYCVSRDVSADFASTNLSVLLGFGIKVKFGNLLGLVTGLRFQYGLSDLKGVDGQGIQFNNPFHYKELNGTSSASAGLFLGLTLGLGGDGDSGSEGDKKE